MKDLGKTVKSRDSENSSMDNDLAELNVTVNERRHIDEVNGKYVTMHGQHLMFYRHFIGKTINTCTLPSSRLVYFRD